MGTGEFNAGGNPAMDYPAGSRNTPSRFMLQKPEISTGLMGRLARMQTLPFTLLIKCSAAPPSLSDYWQAHCNQIAEHCSENETVLGGSRKLVGTAENLIGGSERRIRNPESGIRNPESGFRVALCCMLFSTLGYLLILFSPGVCLGHNNIGMCLFIRRQINWSYPL